MHSSMPGKATLLFLRGICALFTCLIMGTFSLGPTPSAFAATQTRSTPSFSIHELTRRATALAGQFHRDHRLQADLDAALLSQLGWKRMDTDSPKQTIGPLSSNSDITLDRPTFYTQRGYTFVNANFQWPCPSCVGDPWDFNDDFGLWFTQSVPVVATNLYTWDMFGSQTYYPNPTDFNQAGADYAQQANLWNSGDVGVTFAGGWPSGCTEVFSKYSHGWSSNQITQTSVTVGFPPSFGVTTFYQNVAHKWQAVVPTPGIHGC